MKPSHLNLPAKAPESYEELARIYLPRKIHDPVAYQNAIEVVRWLSLRAENKDQIEFLDLISDLTDAYEAQILEEDLPASPVELLNFLVEDNEVSTRELGELLGLDHSTVSRILKGQRSITPEHAQKLGERFAIRPSRFLGLQ